MRARAAYISSFGTSGIIVASALLMLAMMSALVAFHAWPVGTTTGGAVSAVPLTPGGSTSPLHQVRTAPAPTDGIKDTAAAAHRIAVRAQHVSTTGVSKGPASSAARPGTVVKVPAATSGQPQPGQQPAAPTGPQQQQNPPAVHVPPTEPAQPPGSPGPRLQLPSVPLPGGSATDQVEHSVNGVLGSLPQLPNPKLAGVTEKS